MFIQQTINSIHMWGNQDLFFPSICGFESFATFSKKLFFSNLHFEKIHFFLKKFVTKMQNFAQKNEFIATHMCTILNLHTIHGTR